VLFSQAHDITIAAEYSGTIIKAGNTSTVIQRRSRASPFEDRRALMRIEMGGSAIVSLGQAQQLPLRIGQPAFGGDTAEPVRQLAVMFAGIPQPPVPVGGKFLQCGRVFIWHALSMPENGC
jgi:hypothetical protein